MKETLAAGDIEALQPLLAADSKLSWSTTESANSIQLLVPLAQAAIDAERLAVAKLVFEHLNGLVLKTAAGKYFTAIAYCAHCFWCFPAFRQ